MVHYLTEWIDRNGLLKPRRDWSDSGNGVLYTCVYLILTGLKDIEIFKVPIGRCHQANGLLFRTPPTKEKPFGDYGQEQWDNYLGIAALCVFAAFPSPAWKAIRYGLLRFGFYDTDGKLEARDWLWRFPQVWVLMACAALSRSVLYPLRWIFFPAFWTVGRFVKVGDSSGTQLAFVYHWTGFRIFGYGRDQVAAMLPLYLKACESYYEMNHPITEEVKKLCMSFDSLFPRSRPQTT